MKGAPIALGLNLPYDPSALKLPENPTYVPSIQIQSLPDFGCGRPVSVSNLVKYAHVRQAEVCLIPTLSQDAYLLRIETIELTNRINQSIHFGLDHNSCLPQEDAR